MNPGYGGYSGYIGYGASTYLANQPVVADDVGGGALVNQADQPASGEFVDQAEANFKAGKYQAAARLAARDR